MPRYLVQRTFPQGLALPGGTQGAEVVAGIVAVNGDAGVTWVHSYVGTDDRTTFCVYDGPSPEAVRQVAQRNGLPLDSITEVHVLDPYAYRAPA